MVAKWICLPAITKAPAAHVIAHRNSDPANDHRRPILFIPNQANDKPGISTKHTKMKFKYLLPLRLVEFRDSP